MNNLMHFARVVTVLSNSFYNPLTEEIYIGVRYGG